MTTRRTNHIRYVIGDATEPYTDENCIIAHVCNNIGAWGAGFTRALDKKWPELGDRFRSASVTTVFQDRLELGDTLLDAPPRAKTLIANMVAQDGLPSNNNPQPLCYESLDACLIELEKEARRFNPISIHMPRIGCGLAGGEWPEVEALINTRLVAAGLPVLVYDLTEEIAESYKQAKP